MKLLVVYFLAGAFRCVLSFDPGQNVVNELNPMCKKLPIGYHITSADEKYINLIKFHATGRNWNEARKTCFYEGGFLAYATNEEEDHLFVKIINDNKVKDIWTGIHDLFQQGNYSTVLGEVASVTAYLNWRPGQPDNSGGNERCTTLHYDGLGLNDYPCLNAKFAFICKMKLPYCL